MGAGRPLKPFHRKWKTALRHFPKIAVMPFLMPVIPPALAGMDKAEALAYVSRLFDAAQAGAVLWGDTLLLKRFLEQCSRTGSKGDPGRLPPGAAALRPLARSEPPAPASAGAGSCARG